MAMQFKAIKNPDSYQGFLCVTLYAVLKGLVI